MIKKLLLNMIMSIGHEIININGKYQEINIKNWIYHFFNDMINNKDFESNLLKIDKKSYNSINIYYIGYITVKDSDFVKINSVNPLYLIISEVGGYIKEKIRSKYLVFDSANENNEVLKKYNELWDRISNFGKALELVLVSFTTST